MKKFAITAAIIAAIASPTMLLAADSGAKQPATLACRPAAAGETANATQGSTGLVCHTFDAAKMLNMMDKIKAMGDQTDSQAYKDAVKSLLQMETFAMYGGG
jgi:hypothetical protein